jgi:RNA polymerase sigma-70 factor, ECF subfamily
MTALEITHRIESDADDSLVSRFQAGERSAFEELTARYRDRIYNYLRAMGGSDADAEDLTQETFVRAFVNARSFRREAAFHTWLYRIAYHAYLDAVRKQKRRTIVSLDQPDFTDQQQLQELPDPAPGPAQELDRAELQVTLSAALQTLPERLRAVVVLYDIHGYSYEEISRIVACPLGTVRSRLFHARHRLRQKLERYFREEE